MDGVSAATAFVKQSRNDSDNAALQAKEAESVPFKVCTGSLTYHRLTR